jgi:Nucleotidyl transferase AbiEii toxin, Type IV TA system
MDHPSKSKETISRFERLLAALVNSRVDFAVVGGLAIIFNGYPRLTLDADILVHDTPKNLRKLLQCLGQWGEGFARELKPEDFISDAGAVRVKEEFDLDIFTRMRGKSLDDFRPQLRCLETGGVRIPYLSPADLIFLKQDSWRDKDKLDVQAMKEIIARESGRQK